MPKCYYLLNVVIRNGNDRLRKLVLKFVIPNIVRELVRLVFTLVESHAEEFSLSLKR